MLETLLVTQLDPAEVQYAVLHGSEYFLAPAGFLPLEQGGDESPWRAGAGLFLEEVGIGVVTGVVLTVVAVATKIVAGVAAGRGASRLTVGIGMIPRGEVGLIFASIGKSMGVLSGSVFSALVMVVTLSTVVTPPLLKWSAARERT